eukprot:COSAG06_NODE_9486_length_1888_cov_6.752935_1_plen_94_part_10
MAQQVAFLTCSVIHSIRYHDEKQTPGWTGGGNGGPDGVCHGDTIGNNVSGPTQSGYCDCGHGVLRQHGYANPPSDRTPPHFGNAVANVHTIPKL